MILIILIGNFNANHRKRLFIKSGAVKRIGKNTHLEVHAPGSTVVIDGRLIGDIESSSLHIYAENIIVTPFGRIRIANVELYAVKNVIISGYVHGENLRVFAENVRLDRGIDTNWIMLRKQIQSTQDKNGTVMEKIALSEKLKDVIKNVSENNERAVECLQQGNLDKALRLFKIATFVENPIALFNLGATLLKEGVAVGQDYAIAKGYIERSAQQEFLPAMYLLKKIYLQGIGCRANAIKASELTNDIELIERQRAASISRQQPSLFARPEVLSADEPPAYAASQQSYINDSSL